MQHRKIWKSPASHLIRASIFPFITVYPRLVCWIFSDTNFHTIQRYCPTIVPRYRSVRNSCVYRLASDCIATMSPNMRTMLLVEMIISRLIICLARIQSFPETVQSGSRRPLEWSMTMVVRWTLWCAAIDVDKSVMCPRLVYRRWWTPVSRLCSSATLLACVWHKYGPKQHYQHR